MDMQYRPSFGAPRSAATMVPCPTCGKPLEMRRSCTEVNLRCLSCGKAWSLNELTEVMDESVEAALALVPLDRI